MKTNLQLRAVARQQLGKGGAKYRSYLHLGGGQPWCNAFVYWLYHANGCGSLLPWKRSQRTYCPDSIQWCRKNLAEVPPFLALPCDIVYFDWEPNGTPNHVGIVESRISTSKVRTIEGNTSGGKVDRKARNVKYVEAIYRPHFVPTKVKKCKLKEDDTNFGYVTIYNLQCALGMKPSGVLTKETVKILQKRAVATQDGVWGPGTSKKIQKMVGAKADGDFGPGSVKALKKWINKVNFPAPKKPASKTPAAKKPAPAKKPAAKITNAQKLINKAKELAWAYGTAKKKYAYKTGAPKTVCKKAMKKYGWADSKAELSDCGNFVSTIVREAGINKTFKAQHGVKTPFPKTEKGFNTVLRGKAIPSGFLKPGDIIRYKKKNGNQHTTMYFGSGKVCEASHHNRFGAVVKDEKKYNTKSKKNTIQVLRAK